MTIASNIPPKLPLTERLELLVQAGLGLSAGLGEREMMGRILESAMLLTGAEAGVFFRASVDCRELIWEVVENRVLGISVGRGGEEFDGMPPFPILHGDGKPNGVVAKSAHTREVIRVDNGHSLSALDDGLSKSVEVLTGYSPRALLAVPLHTPEAGLLGVLLLCNPVGDGEEPWFTEEDERVARALGAQAGAALSSGLLARRMEELFSSFAGAINSAIDEKSPHTSAHCRRVPMLVEDIATALHSETDGPLSGFLMDESDWRELRLAALLHDCGKVSTPVHIVDKGRKLEGIFDGIEIVEARLELAEAKSSARAWRTQALTGNFDAIAKHEDFREELGVIKSLIRRCNVGSECMSDDDAKALVACSAGWPDLGVSPLLNDDELEALCVKRGTLTSSEREIVNRHIVTSIRILESLPWPAHLARVPEFAGGHHERMDGRGYPKGLKGDEMSVQARIVAVADVFEALTSGDRPYKSRMPLSTAISIMEKMGRDGHLDPDILEIFIGRRVWERYAKEFLPSDSIDIY